MASKGPPRGLADTDAVVRQLKIQNALLICIIILFLLFILAVVLMGAALIVSSWFIYSRVNVIEFNNAVNEVKEMTKAVRMDYAMLRDAMPTNITKVAREALFDGDTEAKNERILSKLVTRWADGITGGAHVLKRMYELKFVDHATPLVTRLSALAATQEAEVGSEYFGEIVNYIGRHARNQTLDSAFRTSQQIVESIRDFILSNATQAAVKKMETTDAIGRISNATARVLESIASIEFNGTRVGADMTELIGNTSVLVRRFNEVETFTEMRDSIYSLANTLEIVAYDGVKLGGRADVSRDATRPRLSDRKHG